MFSSFSSRFTTVSVNSSICLQVSAISLSQFVIFKHLLMLIEQSHDVIDVLDCLNIIGIAGGLSHLLVFLNGNNNEDVAGPMSLSNIVRERFSLT